jgi:hypothetical protein
MVRTGFADEDTNSTDIFKTVALIHPDYFLIFQSKSATINRMLVVILINNQILKMRNQKRPGLSPGGGIFKQILPDNCCNNCPDNRCYKEQPELCQCSTSGNYSRTDAPCWIY